ncbi:transcobalamin-2 isoform X1 [Phacochoerus africanus]|uniref:transcobalamin-2 isoform X1 n=2 Tax=Phacochoerus africanus TaxID=41426 RepID=UPI001FDA0066|nr:transcobalamin-2 isoform X1 [Phacochoerus africanus]XP_047618435.1 transcobalamin-2 isoform X1 [Phacochoerus africanus]
MGCLGALLLLLGGLGALAWTCEIAKVDSDLVERLGQRLLPWMDRLSLEQLNPSIYVGLRLSGLQAGPKEAHYLHSLKLSYQQSLLRSASSNDKSDSEAKPSMGQLALYLLALRANCEFVGSRKGDRLVSQLKGFLETEKRAIGHNHKGHPHTSYYQYGLSILALCLHRKRVHDSVVGKLLYAIEHEQHPDLSVDTTAMAGLAFSCLEVSNLNLNQRDRIALAIQRVQERILRAQTPEGHFGNVYSTPLALQFLMTSLKPTEKQGTACLKAKAALLDSLQHKAFQNPLVISQLLPVLNQKSYVALISPNCQAPKVILETVKETPSQTQVPEVIHVTLKVPSIFPPYKHSISVLDGSSLEDVLKKAQEHGRFRYGTQASLSGPYLTSVMGKKAEGPEYWQLLRAPNIPLLQGIADYRPRDGETIELRLVRW